MKLLINISLLLYSVISYSQQYKKLVDENNLWIIRYKNTDLVSFPNNSSESYYFEYILGDTLINTKTYKKIYHQYFYSNTYIVAPDSNLQQPNIIGYLREDTLEKKVFFVDRFFNFPNEELLFDFSLNLGDTLNNSFIQLMSSGEIDSITSITLINNDTFKVFHLDNHVLPVIGEIEANFMIEGIGGPGGLYNPFYGVGLSGYQEERTIVCFQKDSINLFESCSYPNYITSSYANFKIYNFEIYPNPTFGQVSIRFDELKKAPFVKIRNQLGQIVIDKQYNNTNQIDLDLDVPNGVYFLQIESEGEIVTKKIIKN